LANPPWKPFPYPAGDYDYPGADLRKHWWRLHRGDCEPYPEAAMLEPLISVHADLDPTVSIGRAATTLQNAWRAYHHGEFAKAVELGLSLGLLGYNVANKATNIHATYLEREPHRKLAQFREAAERAEAFQLSVPSWTNAWYPHAQALGRYAQGITVLKALAQGWVARSRRISSGRSPLSLGMLTWAHLDVRKRPSRTPRAGRHGTSRC
jgi:hypothetical protein